MANMAEMIRQEANRAMNSNRLTDLISGTVKTVDPLLVEIDNRFDIPGEFIHFSPQVKTIKLKENDVLTMVRYQKGQLYYVVEINENANTGGTGMFRVEIREDGNLYCITVGDGINPLHIDDNGDLILII